MVQRNCRPVGGVKFRALIEALFWVAELRLTLDTAVTGHTFIPWGKAVEVVLAAFTVRTICVIAAVHTAAPAARAAVQLWVKHTLF